MEADSEQGHMRAAAMFSKVGNGHSAKTIPRADVRTFVAYRAGMHMSQIWIHIGVAQGAYILLEGNLGV